MSSPKKVVEEKETPTDTKDSGKKSCFVIMPIAEHPDYENGHFTRVYEHLIKPAGEEAGYKVIRADDSNASHMIMFDILKKIIDSDMVICDLSSKNANVFYELGLRQAFNKKTILIIDDSTRAPFDINAFRFVEYSPTLRFDYVKRDIHKIIKMLNETENASDNDANSIVKLLQIQPAKIERVKLSQQDSVVFEMIKRLDDKMTRLENMMGNTSFLTLSEGRRGGEIVSKTAKERLSDIQRLETEQRRILEQRRELELRRELDARKQLDLRQEIEKQEREFREGRNRNTKI